MSANQRTSHPWTLIVGAIRVVFGDIGASPLYAFRETFAERHPIAVEPVSILGVLSLIFWTSGRFIWMSRNAQSATDFFRLPTNRVVELGTLVEIRGPGPGLERRDMLQRISRLTRRPIALKVALKHLLEQVRRELRFASGPAGLGEIHHRQVPAMVVDPPTAC